MGYSLQRKKKKKNTKKLCRFLEKSQEVINVDREQTVTKRNYKLHIKEKNTKEN